MSTDSPVQVGEVLAGKFRVEKVLAAGGMGVVVLATHLALQQLVALKFLLPSALKDAGAVARFEREARAAARLKSKHVVRVSDVGTMDDGQPYMVMEYLEGEDLADLISKGKVPVAVALDVMTQVCDALAEAHKLGIVHRDLKPGNIFVSADNNGASLVKVLDFGISKLQNDPLALTSTAQIMGSPLYMSPEQLRASRDVDQRSDMWALGAILYEMLTGSVPFMADNVMELAFKVLETTPEPISKFRDDVPAHVIAAVDACLAKNRDDRVASAPALMRLLVPGSPQAAEAPVSGPTAKDAPSATPSGQIFQPPKSAGSEAPGGIAAATGTSWNTTSSSGGRRPRSWMIAAVAALALGSAGTIAFVKSGSGPAASASGTPSSAQLPTPPSASQVAVVVAAPSASEPAANVVEPKGPASAAPSAIAPTSSANVTKVTRPDPGPQKTTRPAASASASAPVCTVVPDGFDADSNPKFKKVCK